MYVQTGEFMSRFCIHVCSPLFARGFGYNPYSLCSFMFCFHGSFMRHVFKHLKQFSTVNIILSIALYQYVFESVLIITTKILNNQQSLHGTNLRLGLPCTYSHSFSFFFPVCFLACFVSFWKKSIYPKLKYLD